MTNPPEPFSPQAFANAKTNDASAIVSLINSQRAFIAGLASHLISRELQAKTRISELVQDTLTAAFRGFQQYKGETEAELRSWLKTIVTNMAATRTRGYLDTAKRNVILERSLQTVKSDQVSAEIAGDDLSPSSIVSRLEERELLLAKLGNLPDITRDVIVLRYRDDLSFEEIAQRVGKPIEAVKKIWLRGIDNLNHQA